MPKSRRILSKLAIGCMIAAVLPLPAAPFVPDAWVDTFITASSAGVIALLALAVLFGVLARRPVRSAVAHAVPAIAAPNRLALPAPGRPVTQVLVFDEVSALDDELAALDWATTKAQIEDLVRAGRRS